MNNKRWQGKNERCNMKEKKLEIKKIQSKKEKLNVQGQGCWDDCLVWKNNSSTPKCTLERTCYNSCFL